MGRHQALKSCANCPHQNDCQKIGSCLEDINARYLATRRGRFSRLLTSTQATTFMHRLRSGETVRRIRMPGKLGASGCSYGKFKAHCAAYPEWGAEAWRLAKANAKAADALKSPKLYRVLCINGHELDQGRIYFSKDGYECRRCLMCDQIRNARAGTITPAAIVKVTDALRGGKSIREIIHGIPKGGHRRNPSLVLANCVAFYRYRREHPEYDRLVLGEIENRVRTSNPILSVAAGTFKYDWDPNDYQLIRAMLPEQFPDKDVVINEIFVSLLEGRLDRSQIAASIRSYIRDYNLKFPTRYAKFGNSRLVSLDEVLFDDGTATRGDTVSRGLWD